MAKKVDIKPWPCAFTGSQNPLLNPFPSNKFILVEELSSHQKHCQESLEQQMEMQQENSPQRGMNIQ